MVIRGNDGKSCVGGDDRLAMVGGSDEDSSSGVAGRPVVIGELCWGWRQASEGKRR